MQMPELAKVMLIWICGAGLLVGYALAQDAPAMPPPPDIEGYDLEDDPEKFKAVACGVRWLTR